MPRYLFAELIFLIKSFMSTPRIYTHDTTLMYILKPYAQEYQYKARANNLGLKI